MTSSDEIRIRPAGPADLDWITALAPRLHQFGPPPWRQVADMDAAVVAGIARELRDPTPGSIFLAAVDSVDTPLGFVSMRTDPDYFSGEPAGHVVDIVVAKEGEGRGVGRALLAAAERWAIDQGYPWLTLHVFAGNDRARRLYEQVGYQVEWTRMLKRLRPEPPEADR
jgi:ribosomal protein S18 acetylase RimI-like enzyme